MKDEKRESCEDPVMKRNVSVSSVFSGYQETKGTAEPPPLIMASVWERERRNKKRKRTTLFGPQIILIYLFLGFVGNAVCMDPG